MPFEFQTNGIINGISNTDMSMGGLGVVVLHHKHAKASLIPLAITSCGMVCCACAAEPPLKKTLRSFEFQKNDIRNGISNIDMSMGGTGVVVLHHKHAKALLIPLA